MTLLFRCRVWLPLLLVSPAVASQPAFPALPSEDFAAYGYRLQDDIGAKSFMLCVTATRRDAAGHGRIAVNVQGDRDYYAVDLSEAGVRILRVESGLAVAIGRGSGTTLPVGRAVRLVVSRSGRELSVRADGELVARAYDGTFQGGRNGVGALGGSVALGELEQQPDAPVHFDDDFMRAEGEGSDWQPLSGEWKFQAIENALRSSNGFNYRCSASATPAISVVGEWFWDNYAASVACQPHGAGEVGLIAAYASPGDYYRLSWSAAGADGGGAIRLLRHREGAAKELAAASGGFRPGQWYALTLALDHGRLRAFVDGSPVLEAWDDTLAGGKVGLYWLGLEGATFDDLRVHESQEHPLNLARVEEWRSIGGVWRGQWMPTGPGTGRCLGRANGPAKLLSQSMQPTHLEVAADIRVRAQEAGVCAGYQDEGSFYLLTQRSADQTLALERHLDGQVTELGRAPLADAGLLRLSLSVSDGHVCGRANGAARIDAWDSQLGDGAVGLYVRDGQADFEQVTVRQIRALPPVSADAGTFAHESSMAAWSAESSDWISMPAAEGPPVQWHAATVPGDCDIALDTAAPPAGPVSLVLGGAEPDATPGGYLLRIAPGADGRAELLREGSPMATAELPNLSPETIHSLRLTRAGSALGGYLNGVPVLSFVDPVPLPGSRVGWIAPDASVTADQVTVRSANVMEDTFKQAPTLWRTASGQWRVTNRWDCDPRWSFFSGSSDDLACLWHKCEFGESVCVDFFGAIVFDSSRGTPYYEWARDINCTICADGRDLTSGYSFVFGGWDDKYTRLLRGNEVVAETTSALIPRDSAIHTRWFRLRIQKDGARVRCWLDGSLLFDYTDAQPLTGRHVALWTYADSVIIARVRIGSDVCRPPAFPPLPVARPRCCYDALPEGESAP